MVPLKYLSNLWRSLEMPLINCKINIFLTWFEECIIVTGNYGDQKPKFTITNTKLYVPVVTLSAQDNEELLQQLKQVFKITINWNIYQTEPTSQTQNQYFIYSIDPSFQGVNRLFVLSFQNDTHWKSYKQYFLPSLEIKDYNAMIDGKNFLDQPVKIGLVTYESIWKIATGQGDDYTTNFLLDYNDFKYYYKMIAIDLSKQQARDADPKTIQQINFTTNLYRAKEIVSDFSQGTVRVL